MLSVCRSVAGSQPSSQYQGKTDVKWGKKERLDSPRINGLYEHGLGTGIHSPIASKPPALMVGVSGSTSWWVLSVS